jgi:hypothetical protein
MYFHDLKEVKFSATKNISIDITIYHIDAVLSIAYNFQLTSNDKKLLQFSHILKKR